MGRTFLNIWKHQLRRKISNWDGGGNRNSRIHIVIFDFGENYLTMAGDENDQNSANVENDEVEENVTNATFMI